MTSTLAYEIGALFLLAALLMYGTVGGFIPRSLSTGSGLPILLGVVVLAFAIYRFGPDLYTGWRSIGAAAPSLTTSRPAPAAPTPVPRLKKSVAPQAIAKKRPEANWKTTIIDDSVSEPADPVAPLNGKSAEDQADTKPTATDTKPTATADRNPAATADAKPAAESSSGSPYDSKAKRAIKAIGHFLHVGRKHE